MESLEDLLLNANDIPIIIEQDFLVEFCLRGHHLYQSKWEAKVDSQLKACHERIPGALRENCPNTELFLVRIFLYSDWIRRDTKLYIS